MMSSRFISRVFDRTARARLKTTGQRSTSSHKLSMQPLEERMLLTTFFVDGATGSDDNAGSAKAPFATIQAAVNAADESVSPGFDRIRIAAGEYNENVSVDDADGLHLSGRGATITATDAAADTLHMTGGEFRVSGITVQNGANGLLIEGAEQVRLDGVVALDNAVRGIDVEDAIDVRIQSSHAEGNVGDGIKVAGADNVWISQTSVVGNDDGFDLEDNLVTRVVNVVATANGDEGLEVDGGQSIDVVGGEFGHNAEAGIDIDDVRRISITGVYSHDNGEHGLQITAGDDEIVESVIESVTVRASVFANNTGDGMFIVAEDDGSYVQRVRLAAVVATGNTESGADITARDIALRWYLSVGNGEADNLVE